jgi:hypothetical protein
LSQETKKFLSSVDRKNLTPKLISTLEEKNKPEINESFETSRKKRILEDFDLPPSKFKKSEDDLFDNITTGCTQNGSPSIQLTPPQKLKFITGGSPTSRKNKLILMIQCC